MVKCCIFGMQVICRRGMVGRLPSSQPGFDPGGARNFNFYPGTGCVFFVGVLPCVVSGGGHDILLTTDFRETRPCVSV